MTKRLLLAIAPLAALALASCGGDDVDHATPANAGTATATPTATLAAPNLPSPSPVADDQPALSVVRTDGKGGPKTAAELRALPKTELDLGGTKQTGISLATLAAEVEAPEGSIATVEGRSTNGQKVGLWRGTLKDNGASAIFVIDAQGLVSFMGTSVPKEQWLTVVESVSFTK